jgi:hypothetical protein
MHLTIRRHFDVHTAIKAFQPIFHFPFPVTPRTYASSRFSTMSTEASTTAKPHNPALTLELKGKCSVRHRHLLPLFESCHVGTSDSIVDKLMPDE